MEALLLPVQVTPTSVTAVHTEPRHVVVLNLVSNSLSVIEADLVMGDSFDLTPLVEYRRAAVEAFVDLVGRFAQYLKDCICDHFLVNCPPRPENKDLDLAVVSIRGGSVYKVCNFSRRRYVKSFPTVGYWLSLVPVLPALRDLLGRACCALLPDRFGDYSTQDHDGAKDRVNATQVLSFLEIGPARGSDDPAEEPRLGVLPELPEGGELRRLGRPGGDGPEDPGARPTGRSRHRFRVQEGQSRRNCLQQPAPQSDDPP